MKLAGKIVKRQMNLLETEEWRMHNPSVQGVDVFNVFTGRVGEEWISDCASERVLTRQYLSEVAEIGNLTRACHRVVKNKGCAGVDGMSTKELRLWFNSNWRTLQEELLSGHYCPQPVLEVEIPKADGGTRKLGIPTVVDRMVQQAIHQVLSPRYERIFSEYSYGYREGRSAHNALHQCSSYVESGRRWIVDIDLKKFFDTVNQQRLMWLLSRRIGDKGLLRLIHRILKSSILSSGLVSQRISGTPQGGPLSPLLSNIVLDELDKELERRGHRFSRYADDMRIFVSSREAAHRVMQSVTKFIESRLRLRVNRAKSKVCRGYQTNFLGHSFGNKGTLILSKVSERRLKNALKEITSRRRGISLEQLLKELNPKLVGWLNYFRFAQMKGRIQKVAAWLRRRIRCFRLKQCKRVYTIFKFLRKHGVPDWRSWIAALSGKGWLRLSSTPQAHEAMNYEWFEKIGMYDLEVNYKRLKNEETAVYQQVRTVV